MTIAMTLQQHLGNQGVRYEVLEHPPTYTASETAQVSHVSGHQVAKAVLLKEGGRFVLAVLPASYQISFDALRRLMQRDLELASEAEAHQVFTDCETGAVPADGAAYGLDTVVDERLAGENDVYLEAGDHRCLLHISGGDFARLMASARRGRFSTPA